MTERVSKRIYKYDGNWYATQPLHHSHRLEIHRRMPGSLQPTQLIETIEIPTGFRWEWNIMPDGKGVEIRSW